MTSVDERLKKLEAQLNPREPRRCATCADWPGGVFLRDDEPCAYPDRCPSCGRPGPLVVCFTVVPPRQEAV
jgi:hypothetical protein